jgi:cysteate synthase
MMLQKYKLRCRGCNTIYEDDGYMLECSNMHSPALLFSEYAATQFDCLEKYEGIFRYANWLPISRVLPGAGSTITYRSKPLCRLLELPNLWIAFNGYWPEKDAWLQTATFKEIEAYTVLARLPQEENQQVCVVASAGNTAAAFAWICSLQHRDCLIVLPASGLPKMHFMERLDPCVKIVVLNGSADYYDAIMLAERVARTEGFFLEGGVKNVARRDGLGTILLNAVETIGQLPHYYFQSIGSGTGAIAVHDIATKLVQDGRFGRTVPRLMLSQNAPFAPMYRSWKARQRDLIPLNRTEGKKQIQQIIANVLSNQHPAYSVRGGVFDILAESGGDMLTADNHETQHALHLFAEVEGIDIDPAAGVALATLIKAAQHNQIEKDALILLNITGGGANRRCLHEKLIPAIPALEINEQEVSEEEIVEKVVSLCD